MTHIAHSPQTSPTHQTSENIFNWRYWFGEVDTRWLDVFRILFGLLLLKDALYHLPLARIFYSDQGIIPRWILFDGLVRDPRFSLMDAIGEPWLATLFFIIWAGVLIGLVLGYRTRTMAVLNFLFILAVHERNGYILTGADTLMRVMSFWLMFAPIGYHYALDKLRWRNPEAIQPAGFALPMRLLQWQLVIVYISTAYLKTISDIWMAGEALHYVTQIETFILPAGVWLRGLSAQALQMLSYGVLMIEIVIPILLLIPLWWRGARVLAFVLALMLHGGIAVTLSIQDFSILMLICYVLFFDPAWLVGLEDRIRHTPAWARLKAKLEQIISPTADTPVPSSYHQRLMLSAVLLTLFGLVLLWNIEVAGDYTGEGIRYPAPIEQMWQPARNIVWYSGLWQYWDMFSPTPIQYDGWLVVEGQFENGISYDLFTEQALDDERPTRWYWGPAMRWEKFEENVYRWRYDAILRGWGSYYCRTINRDRMQGTRLATLQVVMIVRQFHAPHESPQAYQREQLWYHWCYDEYAPQS
ncbi:MAG: HTTM domain-containing protein [Anaerolineae bacterium]